MRKSLRRCWLLLQPEQEAVRTLESELGVSPTLARVLANRSLGDPAAARRFLHPSLDDLHDPLLLRGMEEALERCAFSIRRGETILVWGDYDVDGVTGTALLTEVLGRLGADVRSHIPHRTEQGYGLDRAAVRDFSAAGVKLIVTVDCGISDAEEVRAARDVGVSCVVTDHHEPPADLPPAAAVLNPRREGCPYPFKHLAGVGIAYKLAQALVRRYGGRGGHFADDPDLHAYLDLVALGTIADVAPLQGENRTLARFGLEALQATARPGLQALRTVAGLESRPLGAAQVGFGLGPRINAAGRLGRADAAVALMLERDAERAFALARHLDAENRRRQGIEAEMLREAIEEVESSSALRRDPVIVLSSPSWHPGVIGIVAARIADRYLRPAVLIATGTEPARGSARSIARFDFYPHLDRCRHLLEAFGGHAHAAGLSIRRERIEAFREEINRLAGPALESLELAPRLEIDAALPFGQIRPPLAEDLRRLAPFGPANPEPTFLAEEVQLARPPRTVGNNHLRLSLSQRPHTRQFIGFHMGDLAEVLSPALRINVAYALDLEGSHGGYDRFRLCDIQFPYLEVAPRG